MSLHRAAVFALVAALVAPQAFAQDDLFVPIPKKEQGKSKQRSSKRRTSKKSSTAKKPAAEASQDDLIVPIPAKRRTTAKKPAKGAAEDDLIVPIPAKRSATSKKRSTPRRPAQDDLIVPITPGQGELLVKLIGGVKGARLFIDDKEVGGLPLSDSLQVETGVHTLVVRRPGFADFSRRIRVKEGKPAEVTVELEAVAGVVTVTSDVPGASVTITGEARGEAPFTGQVPVNELLLKPGSYEIVVSLEGYKPETKSLAVRAGRDYTVVANLRPAETPPVAVANADRPENPVLTPPPPAVTETPTIPLTQQEEEPVASASQPWFKRWYVWAGVGAVVTAATVGTVMATRGDAPVDLRSNPDESVCGGQCDAVLNGSGIIRF